MIDPVVGVEAGSGVYTDNVSVMLVDENGEFLGGKPQFATADGATWSINYGVIGERASGIYSVTVMAEDLVGNTASTVVGTVLLDERAPAIDVQVDTLPEFVITDTLTLTGTTTEIPSWGPVAHYHFEETGSTFHDAPSVEFSATCDVSHCPSHVPALFGQGLSFDGSDDYLILPNLIDPISDTFSISLWFKPETPSVTGNQRILQQTNGTGFGRSWLQLNSQMKLTVNVSNSSLDGTTSLTVGEWHHIVLAFDGSTIRLYLDGMFEGEETIGSVHLSDGDFYIGQNKVGNANLAGVLDELIFYDSALSSAEIKMLGRADNSGVGTTEIAFDVVDFDEISATAEADTTAHLFASVSADTAQNLAAQTLAWLPISLDDPGDALSTWSYTSPAGLENFYEIYLRTADGNNNISGQSKIWRGTIDTLAPRITFTAIHVNDSGSAETEYSFTINDLFVDVDSLVAPCSGDDLTLGYNGNPARVKQVSGSCRVAGYVVGDVSVTACDYFDHCTTETVTLVGALDPVVLTAALSGNTDALLSWTADVSCTSGTVHQSGAPYFTADGGNALPSSPHSSPFAVTGGGAGTYFYKVSAVCGGEALVSEEIGVFSFGLVPGE